MVKGTPLQNVILFMRSIFLKTQMCLFQSEVFSERKNQIVDMFLRTDIAVDMFPRTDKNSGYVPDPVLYEQTQK